MVVWHPAGERCKPAVFSRRDSNIDAGCGRLRSCNNPSHPTAHKFPPRGASSPLRQPIVLIFTLVFLQSRAGGAALLPARAAVPAVLPPGAWMGLRALAKGTGICRDGGEMERKKKKKSAREMNQLLQASLPDLIPVLLFPRRKVLAGRRGRKDFLPPHPETIPLGTVHFQ